MKKLFFTLISVIFFIQMIASAQELEGLHARSYVLMDGKSGTILLEHNAQEILPPASITKIMTMLLAMESLEKGDIHKEDIVTVSENAAILEGSHVFLAPNEQISVHDLLKAIAVASGNDAAIALGEHIAGSEEKFVALMNEKAKKLNMKNTHFVNCNGLDAEGHVSCAKDIAIMTHEISKYKDIFNYTTIWMDTLRNGTFDLANTNKLIRFYEGATGMKTGSTSNAGYCLSATATRNGLDLIAVVMGAKTSKERFADASTLLNVGFRNYSVQKLCESGQSFGHVAVLKGETESVEALCAEQIEFAVENARKDSIKAVANLDELIPAPIEKGQKIGNVSFYSDDTEIASVPLVSSLSVPKISFGFLLKSLTHNLLTIA